MLRSDFHYDLPGQLIATRPSPTRSASRLLCLDPGNASLHDRQFTDLPGLLAPGDLLVYNDTRVIPARLYGSKLTGGRVEVLVERITGPHNALVHLRAAKTPRTGAILSFEGGIRAQVTGRAEDLFVVEFSGASSVLELLERLGHMPLPPYIKRMDEPADRERYQTIYARVPGAVAAPTAGLHFDDEIMRRLDARGVDRAYVTLHVGAGTFQPVRVEDISEHVMHHEYCVVDSTACGKIAETRQSWRTGRGGRDNRRACSRVGVTGWRYLTLLRRYQPLHNAGLPFQERGCAADELSSAGVDPADARLRFRRLRGRHAGLPACGRSGLPFFQLRRRDVYQRPWRRMTMRRG